MEEQEENHTVRNVILVAIAILLSYLYMQHQTEVTCSQIGVTNVDSKECQDYMNLFPDPEPRTR